MSRASLALLLLTVLLLCASEIVAQEAGRPGIGDRSAFPAAGWAPSGTHFR
jgi:hypothetical protein